MKPKPSTRSFFAEWKASAGLSMFDLMHGYVYLRWPYFYIANAVGRHPMLASSGYVAEVDTTRCVACGTCAKSCQFEAITYVDGRKVIDAIRCRLLLYIPLRHRVSQKKTYEKYFGHKLKRHISFEEVNKHLFLANRRTFFDYLHQKTFAKTH